MKLNNKNEVTSINEFVKEKREKLKLRVTELAKGTGIKASRIRTIEKGSRPNLDELSLMGKFCDYTIEDCVEVSKEIEALVKIEEYSKINKNIY